MTGPLQPSVCARCGHQVLPDPQTPGFWVDQQNGRFCGGNPQFPHTGQLAPAQPGPQHPGHPHFGPAPGHGSYGPAPYGQPSGAPGGRSKVWWLAGGAAVLVIALVVTLVVVLGNDAEQDSSAQGVPAAPAPSTTSSAPKAPPEASAPCDPDNEHGMYCFPPEVDGSKFIQRLNKARDWECLKQGQKDDGGSTVSEVEVCEGSNNVDQPYGKTVSIGYETDNYEPSGTMREVRVSATTSAREYRGEKVNFRLTGELAETAFSIAMEYLWHDNKELRKSMESAYKKISQACTNGQGQRPPSSMHELGYEISCSPGQPISVSGDKGTVTSITQGIRITAENPER